MTEPFGPDYSPRILWRLHRSEHVMEARLMPHAQHFAVVILVNGEARAAKAFERQTDALRWADEQRVINAEPLADFSRLTLHGRGRLDAHLLTGSDTSVEINEAHRGVWV